MPKKKLIDMQGEKYGRLLVVAYGGQKIYPSGDQQTVWICRCDCGNTVNVLRQSLTSGRSGSCGCIRGTAKGDAKRGSVTPEYHAWTGMIKRCHNERNRAWHDYGGRGIQVCKEWRDDYQLFLAHVGRKPSPKHSLDRYPDNNGNYEPGNVRWATAEEQIANRRPVQRRNWRNAAKHAYAVVDDFEAVISSYTKAPYVIGVDSCTAALHLVCAYLKVKDVEIPKYSYVGVPASIKNAGGVVKFRDEAWSGIYKLEPYPVYDAARRFTSGMYIPGSFMCLSFHWTKHLSIGRGGAILCDDEKAAEWFKRAAFDGRKRGANIKGDDGLIVGLHYYMTPNLAAQGLMLMSGMSEHNADLPRSDYPDLSLVEAFK